MTAFMPIGYPEHLSVLRKHEGTWHMVLGQWAYKDYRYRQLYKIRASMGHFVMVDNGAAEPVEERVPFGHIFECCWWASEFVLPDVMKDAEATLRASNAHEVLRLLPKEKRAVCPQGSTWAEWEYCLMEFTKRLDFNTICVPKHLEVLTGGRGMAMDIIKRHNLHFFRNIHWLGCGTRYPVEEAQVAANWAVRSIDSAAPLAWAQNGQNLSVLTEDRHSLKRRPLEYVGLALTNIGLMEEACHVRSTN